LTNRRRQMMIEQGDGTLAKRLALGLCPRCQTMMPPVDVHGHRQCSVCHLVIDECCSGERADESSNIHSRDGDG
jgi:hypothetical protein